MAGLRFVSFFAGIGGIDLGLERAGHECVGQVEIDPFCQKVLAKHWPNIWRHDDITTLRPEGIPDADLWTGGFPCQDISSAGKKVGIHGGKSGLFFEFVRLVRKIRPRYVLLENVAMLATHTGGIGDVLGQLAEGGYDAEWETLPAGIFGAPHQRHRVFVVGYSNPDGESARAQHDEAPRLPSMVANSEHAWRALRGPLGRAWGSGQSVPWDETGKCTDTTLAVRVDDGVPNRMDRLRALGNAVVPQVAQYIGELLKEATDG